MSERPDDRTLEAIKQLEREHAQRDKERRAVQAQQRELEAKSAKLEAAERAAPGQMLRAKTPFTHPTKCRVCWIWDGELANLTPLEGTNDVERFSCPRCKQEFETPI